MADIMMRDWAYEFIANGYRQQVSNGETWEDLAYSGFDHDMLDVGVVDGKLFISDPEDTTPSVFLEKTKNGFDLVFEWDGAQMYRDEIGSEFHEEIDKYRF